MLENNKNEEVELDASTKSFALVNGKFVNSCPSVIGTASCNCVLPILTMCLNSSPFLRK